LHRNATPAINWPARVLTWAADEHVVLVTAAGLWLTSREVSLRRRRQSDHLLLSVAAAILPHLLKQLLD